MRDKKDQDRLQTRSAHNVDAAPEGWTLAGLTAAFGRRWPWLVASCIVCLLVAMLYWLVSTPQYTATGLLQLESAPASTFGLANSVSGEAPRASLDALDANMTLETDVHLLDSGTLAVPVIEQLGLERTPVFEHAERAIRSGGLEPLSVPLAFAPKRRYVALKVFAHRLRVRSLGGTRLIEIRYRDPNPERAAAVVNTLMQSFLNYGAALRSAQTAETSHWLSQQLVALKAQTAQLEAQALAAEHKAGRFGLNAQSNLALTQLEALNQQLAEDRANLTLKAAIDHTVASNNPALVSELAGNAADSPGVQNTLSLLQTLEARAAAVRAQIAADTNRYGSRFPQMIALHDQLRSLTSSVQAETTRLGERAHSDYLVALRNEQQAAAQLAREQAQLSGQNAEAVAAVLAREQAEASRNLYEGLLERFRAAGILDALHTTDLSLASPALVPAANHPSSPHFLLDEAVGLLVGLLIGFVLMTAREATDTRLRDRAQTEALLGTPLLGALSSAESSREHSTPEAYRMLRTALTAEAASHPTRVIVVTSPVGGEGQADVALGLGRALARKKKRALLVCADRDAAYSTRSTGSGEAGGGLVALLQAAEQESQGLESQGQESQSQETRVQESQLSLARSTEAETRADAENPNLRILSLGAAGAAGAREARSGVGLGSRDAEDVLENLFDAESFERLIAVWREHYHHIVIEAPPYLTAAEATLLCQLAEVVLLVVRARFTESEDALDALDALERQIPEQTELGGVLVGAGRRRAGHKIGLRFGSGKGRAHALAN